MIDFQLAESAPDFLSLSINYSTTNKYRLSENSKKKHFLRKNKIWYEKYTEFIYL